MGPFFEEFLFLGGPEGSGRKTSKIRTQYKQIVGPMIPVFLEVLK
jgi:hypothetical protein